MDARRACEECTQNCVLVHGTHGQKLDPSSVDNSFVKILYGSYDFSKFLYLPQKVSQTNPVLKDGEHHLLEDYTGKRWQVTLGIRHGALAFEKGWDQFYTDHELKEGYILQFNYMESRFVVKIYDPSGTLKLWFKKNHDKGERSINENAEVEGQKIPDALTKKQASTSIAPGSEDIRTQYQPLTLTEPLSSENGDGRSRRPLTTFLKSRAEKGKEKQVAAKDKDSGPQNGNGNFKVPPTTSLKTSTKIGKNRVGADGSSGKRVSMVENDDQDDLSSIPLKKRTVLRTENTSKSSFKSKIVDSKKAAGSNKCLSVSMKMPEKEPMELDKMPSHEQLNSGKHLKSNELDQISSGSKTRNEAPNAVNTNPVESSDPEFLEPSRESCKAVVESKEALELPVSLPLIWFRKGMDRKVVRLRGVVRPDDLLYHVLYVEVRGLKSLLGGWKNFYNSNALQKEMNVHLYSKRMKMIPSIKSILYAKWMSNFFRSFSL